MWCTIIIWKVIFPLLLTIFVLLFVWFSGYFLFFCCCFRRRCVVAVLSFFLCVYVYGWILQSKTEMINTAKAIADNGKVILKFAQIIAEQCIEERWGESYICPQTYKLTYQPYKFTRHQDFVESNLTFLEIDILGYLAFYSQCHVLYLSLVCVIRRPFRFYTAYKNTICFLCILFVVTCFEKVCMVQILRSQ